MAHPTKIITCCYCGTRAALVLKGKTRHELSCASCGAPLHDLKMLRKDRDGVRELVSSNHGRGAVTSKIKEKHRKPVRPVKKKRRKGLVKKIFEEAFDVIEDIFD